MVGSGVGVRARPCLRRDSGRDGARVGVGVRARARVRVRVRAEHGRTSKLLDRRELLKG